MYYLALGAKRRLLVAVVLSGSILFFRDSATAAAGAAVDISAPGVHILRSKVGAAVAEITVASPDGAAYLRPDLFWGSYEIGDSNTVHVLRLVVKEVMIRVGELELSVPVGVYLGLSDPGTAILSSLGSNRFRLSLRGADAGSSYWLLCEFDENRVLRVSRNSGEFPEEYWAETRYQLSGE